LRSGHAVREVFVGFQGPVLQHRPVIQHYRTLCVQPRTNQALKINPRTLVHPLVRTCTSLARRRRCRFAQPNYQSKQGTGLPVSLPAFGFIVIFLARPSNSTEP
jgi:hypothetical protein